MDTFDRRVDFLIHNRMPTDRTWEEEAWNSSQQDLRDAREGQWLGLIGPVAAPLSVGLEGSAVHLHPTGPTHPMPPLSTRPHLDRERGKLTWPYSGQQRKLPLFLDVVVVVVIALCLCSFQPLVDILERWAKRWSSCPPEEDDLIKDRLCQLQPHSVVYSLVHSKWSTTSCLSQPTGPGSPTGHVLSTREQDLEITCKVQAEQAGGKSGPGQGFRGV